MAKTSPKNAPQPQGSAAPLWAAGITTLCCVAVLQAFLFRMKVNPAALALSFAAVAALVASWGRIWTRGLARSVPAWRAALGGAAALFAMLAVKGSASPDCLSNSTLGLHLASMFSLFLALSGSDGAAPAAEDGPASAAPWAWLVGGSLALGLLTVLARWYANTVLKTGAPSDAIFMFFMPRGADYEGVGGGGPLRVDQWAALAIYFCVALGGLAYLGLVLKVRLRWLLLWLMAVAFAGKLNIAYASGTGLRQIADKIAHIGTAYFALVPRVGASLWNFVLHFNDLQGSLSTHAETHPFGPELLYTTITRIVGYDAYRVGLVMMGLTVFTILPLGLAAARYYKDPWAGAAAGALYLFSPQQLILSGAGTDCLVTLGLAWILYLSLRGSEPGGWAWAAAAGLALFATSLISAGILLPMAYVGLWVLWLSLRQGGPQPWVWLPRAAGVGAVLWAACLLAHLALWGATGGHFNYLKVLSTGFPMQWRLLQDRPYETWVWLNPFLIGAYVGWPLVAILLARLWQGLWHGKGRDGLVTSAAAFAILLGLASLGNAEAQRIFQYAVLVAVLPAVGFFMREKPAGTGSSRLNLPLLAAACALMFLNTALLESLVLDYW